MSPDQLKILKSSFLFEQLSPDAVESFCASLPVERFAPGQVIYHPARFQPAIALLLSGGAAVTGSHGLPMQQLGPGDCFGVAAVFCDAQSYVTTVTAVSQTTLVFLSDAQLRRLFAQHPQTAVSYIAFLSGRIQFLNHKLESLAADTATEALYSWLRQRAACGRVEVASYTALARELNLGRASLYRALDALSAAGVITRQSKSILLHLQPETKGSTQP